MGSAWRSSSNTRNFRSGNDKADTVKWNSRPPASTSAHGPQVRRSARGSDQNSRACGRKLPRKGNVGFRLKAAIQAGGVPTDANPPSAPNSKIPISSAETTACSASSLIGPPYRDAIARARMRKASSTPSPVFALVRTTFQPNSPACSSAA